MWSDEGRKTSEGTTQSTDTPSDGGNRGPLLVVHFAVAFSDPRTAVGFSGLQRVDVLVPRDVLELLFVVRELVFRVRGELEVLCQQDSVDGADLLAQAAVDTLADVEVVLLAVSLVVLDDLDGVVRADVLALPTPDTALLAELVDAAEAWAHLGGDVRVLHRERLPVEGVFHRRRHGFHDANHW